MRERCANRTRDPALGSVSCIRPWVRLSGQRQRRLADARRSPSGARTAAGSRRPAPALAPSGGGRSRLRGAPRTSRRKPRPRSAEVHPIHRAAARSVLQRRQQSGGAGPARATCRATAPAPLRSAGSDSAVLCRYPWRLLYADLQMRYRIVRRGLPVSLWRPSRSSCILCPVRNFPP